MIKNRFLILKNMLPVGIMWKLGFLVSLLALLLPINVFAFENSPSENSENSEQVIQENDRKYVQPIIHISEGTVVYGMDIISHIQQPKKTESKKGIKHIVKKGTKNVFAEKNPKKIKLKQITKLAVTDIKIKTHHSTDSFKLSKQQYVSGTLNNLLLKVAILTRISDFQTIFLYNTNSLYTSKLFLKRGLSDTVFFTRPPPFI